MITGELKHKIDRLWETFWTGGITNPLDVVEQMTYLMFIHDLDATDNQRAKESALLGLPHESIFAGNITFGERTIPGEQLKWSVFHDLSADKMYSTVQESVFPIWHYSSTIPSVGLRWCMSWNSLNSVSVCLI